MTTQSASHIECPNDLLPPGVEAASYDPDTLRCAAHAHNGAAVDLKVKPWVVLHLLRESESAMKADAVILKAGNLREGMRVNALYLVSQGHYDRLTHDPEPHHRGSYVNLHFADNIYSTPADTLYVVLTDG
jgi:hypothetical protein